MHQHLEFNSSLYSEGFYWGVCSYITHTDLYNKLFLKTWWKCISLKTTSLFLHFSSTYMHQHLQFNSSLYSELFYWGVCSYITHTDLYNILFVKTWCEIVIFSIFTFMEWYNEKSKIPSVETFNSNMTTKSNKNYESGFIQHWEKFKYYLMKSCSNLIR